MSNFIVNPIFKSITDELKKAATEYQNQPNKIKVHQSSQPNKSIPKNKSGVRLKGRQEDNKLKNAEILMKLQLGFLALFLFVVWIILKAM